MRKKFLALLVVFCMVPGLVIAPAASSALAASTAPVPDDDGDADIDGEGDTEPTLKDGATKEFEYTLKDNVKKHTGDNTMPEDDPDGQTPAGEDKVAWIGIAIPKSSGYTLFIIKEEGGKWTAEKLVPDNVWDPPGKDEPTDDDLYDTYCFNAENAPYKTGIVTNEKAAELLSDAENGTIESEMGKDENEEETDTPSYDEFDYILRLYFEGEVIDPDGGGNDGGGGSQGGNVGE